MTRSRTRIPLLSSAAALAAGTHAYAEIIHFVNPPEGEPGHYDWHWEFGPWESWLDITRSAEMQPNLMTGTSVGQIYVGYSYLKNRTDGGAAVALDGLTRALAFGDPVNGNAFGDYAAHTYEGYYGILTNFDKGVRAYIGVKTISGNYGWIAVERGTGSFEDRMSLTAFAWAYETIPGKPIFAGEVPAPGTLALLAFGAAVPRARSRRNEGCTSEKMQH